MSDLKFYKDTIEYSLISHYYGDKRAKSSGQLYIQHIDEGVELVEQFGGTDLPIRAFIIHPLVQGDDDLNKNFDKLMKLDARVVALAMEYRHVANSYLGKHFKSALDEVKVSAFRNVNIMLMADKYQNMGDLIKFNQHHPKYDDLLQYFLNWLGALKEAL